MKHLPYEKTLRHKPMTAPYLSPFIAICEREKPRGAGRGAGRLQEAEEDGDLLVARADRECGVEGNEAGHCHRDLCALAGFQRARRLRDADIAEQAGWHGDR